MPAPLFFDIETGPQPLAALLARHPFAAPDHPGEFDPATVKLGNLKDAAKIAEKIAAARAEHERFAAEHDDHVQLAYDEHCQALLSKAALDPTTGLVVAIGYSDGDRSAIDGDGSEAELLARFWTKLAKAKEAGRRLIGFNCLSFDLPFLMRRSWAAGVEFARDLVFDGRWPARFVVDLRDLWLCGQRPSDAASSLDHVARFLSAGQKPESVGGADFARLWTSGDAGDRLLATEYLLNDLSMTVGVAKRLGVL